MNWINTILTPLGDWLLRPFQSWPLAGLVFWSAVSGVVMTYVFGRTSNQRALRRVADDMRANLLAIKLFKDDLSVTFRCQLRLLKAAGWRLLLSLPPGLVMIAPFALILSQLALRYEHHPLAPGENTLVHVSLSPSGWDRYQNVQLRSSDDLVIETESLRDAFDRSLTWRVRPTGGGPVTLEWVLDDQIVEKQLAVAENNDVLGRVSIRRPGVNWLDRLLNPGESGFASTSPVRGVAVQHPPRDTPVFGFNLPWWLTFLAVSMLTAWLCHGLLGVQI